MLSHNSNAKPRRILRRRDSLRPTFQGRPTAAQTISPLTSPTTWELNLRSALRKSKKYRPSPCQTSCSQRLSGLACSPTSVGLPAQSLKTQQTTSPVIQTLQKVTASPRLKFSLRKMINFFPLILSHELLVAIIFRRWMKVINLITSLTSSIVHRTPQQ